MKNKTTSKNATSKDTAGTDILTLVKDQHKILKECIKTITSEKAEDEAKHEALIRFIPTLKMHSEAEEQTIYALMTEKAEEEDEEQMVMEAEVEHSLAKSLVEELEEADYKTEWSTEIAAKAKVLAEIVEHHAEEEEDEFFKAVRENLDKSERLEIGLQFQQKCDEVAEEGAENPSDERKTSGSMKPPKQGKKSQSISASR